MWRLFFKSIVVGLKRRWLLGLRNSLTAIGLVWTLTEIALAIFPKVASVLPDVRGEYVTAILVLASVAFFWTVYEIREVKFRIPATDTFVTLKYGNLLAQQADLLIGVNECFDSEIGILVSKNSLHGQAISHFYQGDSAKFRNNLDLALAGKGFEHFEREHGANKKYKIGTTAVLRNGAFDLFLVAMAHTDALSAKASSDVPTLWIALKGAFETIVHYGNGKPLALPLMGNGQSSVNIEPQHLLRLIVLSLVDFSRNASLPKSVSVVLPDACFDLLDIREIERDWKRI